MCVKKCIKKSKNILISEKIAIILVGKVEYLIYD